MDQSWEYLPFHPPLDWEGLLNFFAPRAIPGVESISEGRLRRCFRQENRWGVIDLSLAEQPGTIQIRAWNHAPDLNLVRRVLDLDHQPSRLAALFQSDDILGPLWARWPGVRLPGAWDPFEMGVRAILGQQISVKAAHTLAARLVARWGQKVSTPWPGLTHLFPLPEDLAGLQTDDLANLGLPTKRAETLRQFALWSCRPITDRPPLGSLPGIGPWTENYLKMRGQSYQDAFPAGDLGIQKALGIQNRSPAAAAREAETISQRWRPYRAYAVFLLWRSLG
ncbi:MAG: DNA-3-methyladenine glycosylase family protein [Acidobacteriota bacterium]